MIQFGEKADGYNFPVLNEREIGQPQESCFWPPSFP